MCESIFEAKGGLRCAVVNAASGQSWDVMMNQPVIKKAMNATKNALKKGLGACTEPLHGGKQVLARCEENVQASFGAELRSKMALPRAPWANSIYNMNVFASGAAYANAMWPPFGMMQAIVVVSGDATIAGIKNDRIPGSTFGAKRQRILQLPVDDVKRLICDGGWLVKFKDGVDASGHSCVVMPSGFMILTAATNATCLQWSLAADALDTQRVKDALKNMLDAFPEVRPEETGYNQLAGHLGLPR